jgi:hypothetical protein
MRNVLDKNCTENQNIHFMSYNFFFFENRTGYDIMSKKNSGDRGATNDVTIWRIRVACGISKAICTYAHVHTDTHHVRNTYCFSTTTMVS